MTQTLMPAPSDSPVSGGSIPFFIFDNVSWEFYEQTLLELERHHSHIRVAYDDGSMQLMAPGNEHEQTSSILSQFIILYAAARDIDVAGTRSVTLQLKAKRKGVEADESFYVQTPAPPIKAQRLDLKKYPPPDLAIEIDISGDP